jgi:heme peroxidase
VPNILIRANEALWKQVNRAVEWHDLPKYLALLNLRAFRDELRQENLYDPDHPQGGNGAEGNGAPAVDPKDLPKYRTYDGSLTDPKDPHMGQAGARFGRNHPLGMTFPEPMPQLLEPSPRTVSTRLLNRDTFKPATTLNVLAACWIQFENHDWFSHGDNSPTDFAEIPLEEGDDWGEAAMKIRRTSPDPDPLAKNMAPTYVNTVTHWWDGSQIYGSSEERNRQLRTGEDGTMIVEDGRLPNETDPVLDGIDLTGFSDNYWIGLSFLHTLFVKEHNAICHYLKSAYPTWDDEQLFLKARLVNAALHAKIHTVEWTPGILATPVLQAAMHANWYGALPQWARRFRVDALEGLFGVIGGQTKHHTAQYAITEEFASVYRLHPLIPDDWEIRSHKTGKAVGEEEFTNIQGKVTRDVIDRYGWSDLLYTFGTAHPGAITLHNHPRALQNLTRINGDRVDIGTIDIYRDRERGVPRYNDFREKLRKPRVEKFEDITENQKWAREIKEIYEGDIDRVDLQVGLLAETPPEGFGFSDTAFRIFILMASRRLKSDRFFTMDYHPDVYTPEGLDWIDKSTMVDVLLRHHPELSPALEGVENAFAPWQKVG